MQGNDEEQTVQPDDNVKDHSDRYQVITFNRGHHNLVSKVSGSSYYDLVGDKIFWMKKSSIGFPHDRTGGWTFPRKFADWLAEQATVEPVQ